MEMCSRITRTGRQHFKPLQRMRKAAW
ncbi:hypothetical protein Pint_22295 [Pistacia integerrima]|uniref:Uncharacterized protein n=1 Tax=Pistacia integerrima TaxID=434235 RepID=A0ACC0YK43_9ROSI|nr:hypothetical protein Pint_22295 [Pistacia integerrima]